MEQHISQYRIFYAVAKAGSISRAAKELFISQPAISKSISKLEDSLMVSLFSRNSRGVRLTQEGQVLFDHVAAAFDSLEKGESELRRIREFHIGHIRIGVSNTLCKYILLPYLKEFVDQYPHINVTIESQDTARTLSMLEQGRLDLGLVAEPETKKGLVFCPVMEIEDTFAATGHYLENLRFREGQTADIFRTGNIMMLDRSNMTRHHIDEYLAQQYIEPAHILEVSTMDLLIEFTRIGLGIGCVIKEFVRKELESGQLVEIPLGSPIHKRTVSFASRPGEPSQAMAAFFASCGLTV